MRFFCFRQIRTSHIELTFIIDFMVSILMVFGIDKGRVPSFQFYYETEFIQNLLTPGFNRFKLGKIWYQLETTLDIQHDRVVSHGLHILFCHCQNCIFQLNTVFFWFCLLEPISHGVRFTLETVLSRQLKNRLYLIEYENHNHFCLPRQTLYLLPILLQSWVQWSLISQLLTICMICHRASR